MKENIYQNSDLYTTTIKPEYVQNKR